MKARFLGFCTAVSIIFIACTSVAFADSFSQGVSAYQSGDYQSAYENWLVAAQSNHPVAQNNIGLMYENGLVVTQNFAEAEKWYRKSALQGYPRAQTSLGALYARGLGVTQSYEEALRWYQQAANQGFAVAQSNIGIMYEYGQGVRINYEEASRWYRLAAVKGFADAQTQLGLLYSKGFGVEKSVEQACAWWIIASTNGSERARHLLEQAQKNMTNEQIIATNLKAEELAESELEYR